MRGEGGTSFYEGRGCWSIVGQVVALFSVLIVTIMTDYKLRTRGAPTFPKTRKFTQCAAANKQKKAICHIAGLGSDKTKSLQRKLGDDGHVVIFSMSKAVTLRDALRVGGGGVAVTKRATPKSNVYVGGCSMMVGTDGMVVHFVHYQVNSRGGARSSTV